MKHRNNHFAVGYWSRIRQGRALPDQADVDPKALKRLLPFVFLLDARPDGGFTYRLAGTALCDRHGGELRGKSFFDQWDDQSRVGLAKALRSALVKRTPICLTSIGSTDECHMIEIETVLLPITFGDNEPQRFLGVTQILTDVMSLAGRTIAYERLVSAAIIPEGDDDESDNIELPPPPPPPVKGFRPHPKAPHLRLVVSQDIPRMPRPAGTMPLHRHTMAARPETMTDPLTFDPQSALRRLWTLCANIAPERSAAD